MADIPQRVASLEANVDNMRDAIDDMRGDVGKLKDWMNKTMGSNSTLIFIATFAANGMIALIGHFFK